MSTHSIEVQSGERFRFGDNWRNFLATLDDERIEFAMESLVEWLGDGALDGKRFLDIGSGSGLFSLAARKLGATVISFDFDPASVACTSELRSRYFGDDPNWTVLQGSVLDKAFMRSLPGADITYSWGVLHHTGNMWQAIENAQATVNPSGRLFIAIYNDQGNTSKRWTVAKKTYNKSALGKAAISAAYMTYYVLSNVAAALWRGRSPLEPFRAYKRSRGMSWFHDIRDWLGGYPFEVAKPEQIFYYLQQRGFELQKLKTCGGGLGCNEFVFCKRAGGQ